jgi:hypothetical protein
MDFGIATPCMPCNSAGVEKEWESRCLHPSGIFLIMRGILRPKRAQNDNGIKIRLLNDNDGKAGMSAKKG